MPNVYSRSPRTGTDAMDPKDCYDVNEFCVRHGISRATLYNLWNDGRGPRRMKVGAARSSPARPPKNGDASAKSTLPFTGEGSSTLSSASSGAGPRAQSTYEGLSMKARDERATRKTGKIQL